MVNRRLTISLNLKLFGEIWSGKQANLYHLKVFGCVSYLHIGAAKKTKLDVKSSKCYLGYDNAKIGHRFQDGKIERFS